MDIGNKKTKAIIVLSLLMILCLCMASVLSFLTPNKSAEAVGNFRDTINVDNITINVVARSVKKGDKKIDLTPKEIDLLMLLVQNKNTALYREIIFEKVWGEELEFETRTLDLHIQRLRKKLDWKDKIKTVYKIGYMLEIV